MTYAGDSLAELFTRCTHEHAYRNKSFVQDFDIEYTLKFSDPTKIEELEKVLKSYSSEYGRDLNHCDDEISLTGYTSFPYGACQDEDVLKVHHQILRELQAIDPKSEP